MQQRIRLGKLKSLTADEIIALVDPRGERNPNDNIYIIAGHPLENATVEQLEKALHKRVVNNKLDQIFQLVSELEELGHSFTVKPTVDREPSDPCYE